MEQVTSPYMYTFAQNSTYDGCLNINKKTQNVTKYIAAQMETYTNNNIYARGLKTIKKRTMLENYISPEM